MGPRLVQIHPVEKFSDALRALCPGWKDERFLIAFSGGLDSTALLTLALKALSPEQIIAAHLNHGLRGEAAEGDQRFAARVAAERAIDFITDTVDVAALASARGKGVEEAARKARYAFLENAAIAARARYILTAHHADDQTETILMNFIRGTGAGGLAGIHPSRPLGAATIVRPLLNFTREELKAVVMEAKAPWVEDASNQDARYRRNALRLDILPELKKINPRLTNALSRVAIVLRSEEDFWQGHLKKLWPQIVLHDDESANTVALSRPGLAALTVAEQRRFIYEVFLKIKGRFPSEVGEPLSLASVEIVLTLLTFPAHKGLDIPGGLRAEVGVESVLLSPASRFI